MNTEEWGTPMWDSFMFIASGSPEVINEECRMKYKTFFTSVPSVLPCSICQKSFTILTSYVPIDNYLDSRYGLMYWVFIMHNLVNRKLNKECYTFDKVLYKYENIRSRCGSRDSVGYAECKKNLKEYSMDEAKYKSIETFNKYKEITNEYLLNYYNSDKLLDHNIIN